jgi:hypothetical protein
MFMRFDDELNKLVDIFNHAFHPVLHSLERRVDLPDGTTKTLRYDDEKKLAVTAAQLGHDSSRRYQYTVIVKKRNGQSEAKPLDCDYQTLINEEKYEYERKLLSNHHMCSNVVLNTA